MIMRSNLSPVDEINENYMWMIGEACLDIMGIILTKFCVFHFPLCLMKLHWH